MSYRTVTEGEFRQRVYERLSGIDAKAVTGPGRSGAVASVYASHILGLPWIPYGQPCPDKLRPLLIVDTADWTGATIRKAQRRYGQPSKIVSLYHEPPMVRFWYEDRAGNRIHGLQLAGRS